MASSISVLTTMKVPRKRAEVPARKLDQPIHDGSSVLAFMQSPTNPRHELNILQRIAQHLIGREGFALVIALGLSADFKSDIYTRSELSRMSRRVRLDGITASGFDHENQAWVVNGKYVHCTNFTLVCGCFGCRHTGENVRP